jgi:hypothetical protein
VALAQRAVATTVEKIGAATYDCGCDSALSSALLTHRDRIPAQVVERLGPIVGKYFKANL